MLFDLIRCHARLNFCQRKRDEDGSIIATREDFDSGKNLYTRINGDTGGQETKLTRNEAAALSSVAKAGLTGFSIRNLQELTGLSYYQTYRILHGYNSRGTSYAGLLEKCPALTCVDTTVTLDEDGYCVRRRENHYSFDFEMYKVWIGGGDIWLDESTESGDDNDDDGEDDSPDSPADLCSFIEDLQQGCKGCCKDQNLKFLPDHQKKMIMYVLVHVQIVFCVHPQEHRRRMPVSLPGVCLRVKLAALQTKSIGTIIIMRLLNYQRIFLL